MRDRVLVTGGAGFVGSSVAICLKDRHPKVRVVALDNLKRRGSEMNIPRLKDHGVEFIHGDIRNPEDLDIGPDGAGVIIECSAEPSVMAGINSSPGYLINTNLVGTINCLEAARRWRSDVIFISTSRVYPIPRLNSLDFDEDETRFVLTDAQREPGASADGITSDFPLTGHRSLYGATKLASELMLEEYQAVYGIRGVVNRCGVVAGPWQMGRVDQGVFVHWVGSHYFNRPLAYFGYGGTGKQVRDLLHVDDLCRLIDWELQNMKTMDRTVINVGGGRGVSLSLAETTELSARITGRRMHVTGSSREREADVRIYITDNTRATEVTGWSPERGPEDILADIYDWIAANEVEVKRTLFPDL